MGLVAAVPSVTPVQPPDEADDAWLVDALAAFEISRDPDLRAEPSCLMTTTYWRTLTKKMMRTDLLLVAHVRYMNRRVILILHYRRRRPLPHVGYQLQVFNQIVVGAADQAVRADVATAIGQLRESAGDDLR